MSVHAHLCTNFFLFQSIVGILPTKNSAYLLPLGMPNLKDIGYSP
ncbi:hypothetical protein MXB_1500 [Myxobolus squamalis]|nr:hypothetical protein MXB_1500 [Myxobolus squamalis]